MNDLSFSVDMLSYLNEMNLSLQGKGLFIYEMYTNVISFTKKKIKIIFTTISKETLVSLFNIETMKK